MVTTVELRRIEIHLTYYHGWTSDTDPFLSKIDDTILAKWHRDEHKNLGMTAHMTEEEAQGWTESGSSAST